MIMKQIALITTESATSRMIDPARGTHQPGMRAYNERLVLSLIRRHGSLPKAEIARLTGLSAQTVSVIVRQLERERLVIKERPQRGKVGQPLVPFSLNPEGAYFIGIKIGRRSGDLLLLDLAGQIRAKLHKAYTYPTPDDVMAFVEGSLEALTHDLSGDQRQHISGLGVGVPFELWNWEDAVGAPREVMTAWQGFDLQHRIETVCPWPVHFCNDATAACAGELVFGSGSQHRDYVYFFISYFIGGGIVMGGSLEPGRTGNAGALGSMPVPEVSGGARQLIHSASLYVLERALRAEGRDPALLWQSPDDWGDVGQLLEQWIETAATGIAYAIAASAAVFDFPTAIIDGAFPPAVRSRLVERIGEKIGHVDRRGLSPFGVIAGTIGSDARALGAASLPLLANFAIDRNVLFKDAA
jgi:predicted NBD/HSP70 family sugar kinase